MRFEFDLWQIESGKNFLDEGNLFKEFNKINSTKQVQSKNDFFKI